MNINKTLLNNYRLMMVSGTKEDIITNDEFNGFEFVIKSCGYKLSDALNAALFYAGKESLQNAIDDLDLLINVDNKNPLISDFASSITDKHLESDLAEFFNFTSNKVTELIDIDLLTYDKSIDLFYKKINSKTVWSENDKDLLNIFFEIVDNEDISKSIKESELTIRENKSFLASLLYKNNFNSDIISEVLTSASDIIRFVYELDGINIKIENFNSVKLKFSNKESKMILNLLNNSKNLTIDMFSYQYEFKKLSRVIHPMTNYNKNKYPNTYKSFKALMNNNKPKNWGMLANDVLVNSKSLTTKNAIKVYSERPGEFGRNLRTLLCKYSASYILEGFKLIANEIPSKLLFEMYATFTTNDYEVNRVTTISNNLTKLDDTDKVAPHINKEVIEIILGAIKYNLSKLDTLGPIVLDDSLKTIPVPIQERESSSAFSVLPKLSKIKIPSGTEVIRSFVYWVNGTEKDHSDRIDIDSSLIAVKENGETLRSSWNSDFSSNNKYEKSYLVYSGDVQDAPKGGIEYHDSNIKLLKDAGFKYVISDLRSYTMQPFSKMSEACFGFQYNQDLIDPLLFDPSKVETVMSLNNNSTNLTTMVIDLINDEIVWINTPINSSDNISNLYDVDLIDRVLNLNKLSIYDLITLNIESRNGTLISKDDYDLLDDEFKKDVTIFDGPGRNKVIDISNILSNFIA